jgi:hypothetical protein
MADVAQCIDKLVAAKQISRKVANGRPASCVRGRRKAMIGNCYSSQTGGACLFSAILLNGATFLDQRHWHVFFDHQ